MKELHLKPSWDKYDYLCELTQEMDKHLLKENKNDYMQTYLYSKNPKKEFGMAIRFPGATRGHIEFNSSQIITDIVLYDTACDNVVACYKPIVKEAVKKFIGYKVIL